MVEDKPDKLNNSTFEEKLEKTVELPALDFFKINFISFLVPLYVCLGLFLVYEYGFINLLSIPVADGGLILFFTFEKIRGKPLSLRKQIVIQQVGIWLLIFLFILVTWNDILRWFRG